MGLFSVSIVLGLTWIFGAFIVSTPSLVFRYLFVISTTFQGFVFFIFIALVGPEGRAFWIKTLRLNTLSTNRLSSTQNTPRTMSALNPDTKSIRPSDLTSSIEKHEFF